MHRPEAELATSTRVSTVAFSPAATAQLLSCGSADGGVTLWDCGEAAAVRTFRDHTRRVWSLAYSTLQPDTFVSGSDDGTLRLWQSGQTRSVLSIALGTAVCCVATNPLDAHLVAAGTAGHALAVYDTRHAKAPLACFSGAAVPPSVPGWFGSNMRAGELALSGLGAREWEADGTRSRWVPEGAQSLPAMQQRHRGSGTERVAPPNVPDSPPHSGPWPSCTDALHSV